MAYLTAKNDGMSVCVSVCVSVRKCAKTSYKKNQEEEKEPEEGKEKERGRRVQISYYCIASMNWKRNYFIMQHQYL